MAFLKFFCLFKQLKSPDECTGCSEGRVREAARLHLVSILQIHKKLRQMHFLWVERASEEERGEGQGERLMGTHHNFPLLTSAGHTAAHTAAGGSDDIRCTCSSQSVTESRERDYTRVREGRMNERLSACMNEWEVVSMYHRLCVQFRAHCWQCCWHSGM